MVDYDYQSLISLFFSGNLNGQYYDEIPARNSKVRRIVNLDRTFWDTPLVSIRKTAWKNALREMEWFLSGSSNINDLHPAVRHWWEPWADKDGIVRNNYGKQLRHFNAEGTWQDDGGGGSMPGSDFDQIAYLIENIKSDPYSRRHVVTTWNTADMADVRTPITNCHGTVIQLFCHLDGRLSMFTYQRSADMVVGVPHNWIQYWALLLWLCRRTKRKAKSMQWTGGDCHIYEDHLELAREISEANPFELQTPQLKLAEGPAFEFKADDFELLGEYRPTLNSSAKLIV